MRPTFTLRSAETDADYHLYVEAPPRATRQPLPVVLFMDGDNQFRAAQAAYRALRKRGAVQPLLLVGVGYGASYGQPAEPPRAGLFGGDAAGHTGGRGADAFLRFLTGALWRELGRRYRIHSARRGLAGHSLGSLLVLHALFGPRRFFTHCLASAPSIWWGRGDILRVAARRRERTPRLPARLFLRWAGAIQFRCAPISVVSPRNSRPSLLRDSRSHSPASRAILTPTSSGPRSRRDWSVCSGRHPARSLPPLS